MKNRFEWAQALRFSVMARAVAAAMGSAWAFFVALLVVLVWGITGPVFEYSDTWQLVINTGTTIVTFLMVFLIQNTQNRDSRALHLKLVGRRALIDQLVRHVPCQLRRDKRPTKPLTLLVAFMSRLNRQGLR
ncbi:MAG: low affinity iron permease family protein, partial [Alphaproteobacteria bacterium]|nr:low affinity iron permease family protein [Alphaproteobacteria bacterium]